MAGFEKVRLATGEFRGDYIARRLKEGVAAKAVAAEINQPGFYSGPEGKTWPDSVVYAEQRKLKGKAARSAIPDVALPDPPEETEDDAPELDASVSAVPPEYEDVLTPADMAEVRAEAAAALKKKARAAARKDMLARATQELEREAARLAQEGDARGDMVDIDIDLSPSGRSGKINEAPCIKLDGRPYVHGRTYRVPRKVFNTLMEIIQRGWQHEGTLHGESDNSYRRSRGSAVGHATSAQGLRA